MLKPLRLLLRPIERFLAQWISVSTHPTHFVQEAIHLGDTTNFFRAGKFFLTAISAAFFAETATLYLLGIGNLTEPYYWLFILLTSIPFVLFCFLLLRFVAPLPFKDVLHISLYPIGAGVFTGAAFALVTSAIVALLVAAGYLPPITYDLAQWGTGEQLTIIYRRVMNECVAQESFLFRIIAAGFQETYIQLKPPIDAISYLRPLITIAYLLIAAIFFMAAAKCRKATVFGMVLLAALIATIVNVLSAKIYVDGKFEHSSCRDEMDKRAGESVGESALKVFAADMQAGLTDNDFWTVSVHAEGRTLTYSYRFKEPINMAAFPEFVNERQKDLFKMHCSKEKDIILRFLKATEVHTYYSSEGERLTSFSISPADCPKP